MKKPKPIVDATRLNEVSQKVSDLFIEEKLSPLEIKLIIDTIYNNLESIEDICVKSNYVKAITPNNTLPGVS